MNDLEQLFDAYDEGDLSDSDRLRLGAWLSENPHHVDQFVRESFLHSELFSIARQRFVQEGVRRRTRVASAGANSSDLYAASSLFDSRKRSRRGRHYWAPALAAGLAAVAAWGLWIAGTRPAVVGQLTQGTAGAVWQHQSEVRKAGDFVYQGQELQLVRGRALLTLGSGARVVVEGPAHLQVVDDNRVRLETGRLGATVPTQAIGFTVETSAGDFVDLGTEFTVELQSDGKCRLFVFTGMVEMRPNSPGRLSRPFQIAQTQAVTYDPATDLAKPMPIGDEVKLAL